MHRLITLACFLLKDDNSAADLVRLFSYRFIFRQNILKFVNVLTYSSPFREQTHQNLRQSANSNVVQIYSWLHATGEFE